MSASEAVEEKEYVTELNEAIDAAAEEARANVAKANPDQEQEEEFPEDVAKSEDVVPEEESSDEGEEGGDEGPTGPSKSTIQEAVRAGIPLEDAEAFPTDELLRRQVKLLKGPDSDGGDAVAEGESADESDPLRDIPDLDPEEWDESIVSRDKAQREIIRQMFKDLNDIKSKFSSQEQQSAFDKEVESLDESYREVIQNDQVIKTELKTKVDILDMGYKASGQNVSRSDVLKEAVRLVVGEVKSTPKPDKKEVVQSRQGRFTNRPSNSKSSTRQSPEQAEAELVKELNSKYYN